MTTSTIIEGDKVTARLWALDFRGPGAAKWTTLGEWGGPGVTDEPPEVKAAEDACAGLLRARVMKAKKKRARAAKPKPKRNGDDEPKTKAPERAGG